MNNVVYYSIVIPLGLFTVAYLGLVLYLINNYLPRTHASVWVELGRPLFQHPLFRADNMQEDFRKWLLTARFMLLANQYASLKDAKLNKLIWSIRMLFVGMLFLWAMLITFGFKH